MSELSARPSAEHLRKAAKRLARDEPIPLAIAQRRLARTYGFRNWAELMHEVARRSEVASPLLGAVRRGNVDGVRELLDRGVNPRLGDKRNLPLHAAARSGPLELVEVLIAGGALPWQVDSYGRTALYCALLGRGPDRAAIVELLDRTQIVDPAFRDAGGAIHAGDVRALARLLDADADLLRRPNMGPEAFRRAKRHN